ERRPTTPHRSARHAPHGRRFPTPHKPRHQVNPTRPPTNARMESPLTENARPYDRTKTRTKIDSDLTTIEELAARLLAEATHRASDAHMPGGPAMVMLGPGADIEAYAYAQLSEIIGRTTGITEIALRSDVPPPVPFLASWADIVRDDRGHPPTSSRATLAREIRYLRSALDWIVAADDETGQPLWHRLTEFQHELHTIAGTLQAIMRAGEQIDRGASCLECGEPLDRQWADGPDKPEYDDVWKCRNRDCHATPYRYGQYMQALHNEY